MHFADKCTSIIVKLSIALPIPIISDTEHYRPWNEIEEPNLNLDGLYNSTARARQLSVSLDDEYAKVK